MALFQNYKGLYRVVNENVWPECKLEDFYLFKSEELYHIMCEDNVGGVSGHKRWGVHLNSKDGITNWLTYNTVVVYDHDLTYQDNTVLHLVRRERPQLLITNGKITHLINGVYDGTNSWCQLVELKKQIKIEDGADH
jgi:hypothetical protein